MHVDPNAPEAANEERYVGIGPSQDVGKGKGRSKVGSLRRSDSSANSVSGKHLTGGAHRRVNSEEFEDHMEGSPFDPDEICKGCGFPRQSSVWCPVTQRHHGTDELMASGRQGAGSGYHSRSTSGGGLPIKGLFSRIKNKLTPQHNSARHGGSTPTTPKDVEAAAPVRAAGLPPLSPSHQPPPGRPVEDMAGTLSTAAPDPPSPGREQGEEEQAVDSGVQYVLGSDGYYYAYVSGEGESAPEPPSEPTPAGHPVEETAAGPEECPDAGEGERVQYYAYTDENGETFYYAEEIESEGVSMKRTGCAALTAHDVELPTQAQPPETGAAEGECTDPQLMLAVRNETGETNQYVSHGSERPSVDGGSSSTDVTGSMTPKKKKTFGDVMSSLFKPKSKKPGKSKKNGKDRDAEEMTELPSSTDGGPVLNATAHDEEGLHNADSGTGGARGLATPELSHAELERRATVDAAVAAFMETLDGSERKKFEKERKRLIKELDAEEKREREQLVKQRRGTTEDLDRERRACLNTLRSDARAALRGEANRAAS